MNKILAPNSKEKNIDLDINNEDLKALEINKYSKTNTVLNYQLLSYILLIIFLIFFFINLNNIKSSKYNLRHLKINNDNNNSNDIY